MLVPHAQRVELLLQGAHVRAVIAVLEHLGAGATMRCRGRGRRGRGLRRRMAIPERLRADQMALRIAQLVVHVLGILTGAFGSAPAHRADRIAGAHDLAFLHRARIQMQDLVRVALRVADLHRAVLAAGEGHRAVDGRMDGRMPQVAAGLAALVVEVGAAMRPLATMLTEVARDVAVLTALARQHALHRLLEAAVALRVGGGRGRRMRRRVSLGLGLRQALFDEALVTVQVGRHLALDKPRPP